MSVEKPCAECKPAVSILVNAAFDREREVAYMDQCVACRFKPVVRARDTFWHRDVLGHLVACEARHLRIAADKRKRVW